MTTTLFWLRIPFLIGLAGFVAYLAWSFGRRSE
jgi:hypothetical protein